MHPFRVLVAFLPSPSLHNVETQKTFLIDVSNVVCGVGEGLGMFELKKLHKCKSVQRLLSMFVDKDDLFSCFHHSQYIVIRQLRRTLELKRKNQFWKRKKRCIFACLFICFFFFFFFTVAWRRLCSINSRCWIQVKTISNFWENQVNTLDSAIKWTFTKAILKRVILPAAY